MALSEAKASAENVQKLEASNNRDKAGMLAHDSAQEQNFPSDRFGRRFHLPPLRGALTGLNSLFGRGEKGKKSRLALEAATTDAQIEKEEETMGEDENGRKNGGRTGTQEEQQAEENEGGGEGEERAEEASAGPGKIGTGREQMPLANEMTTKENARTKSALAEIGQQIGGNDGEERKGNGADGIAQGGREAVAADDDAELLEPMQIPPHGRTKNGAGKSAKTKEEPKPRKRLRRGSSAAVAPLELTEAAGMAGQQGNANARTLVQIDDTRAIRTRPVRAMPTLWPIESSRPNQWVYVQMADRTFKRTTEAELQSRGEAIAGADGGPAVAALLPSEYASVGTAIWLQSTFHSFALGAQGFLSGLAFAHALFAFLFVSADSTHSRNPALLESYATLAVPSQTVFYVALTAALVDILDRFRVVPAASGSLSAGNIPFPHYLFSTHSLAILCWLGAFISSISAAQVDEYFTNHNWGEIFKRHDASHALSASPLLTIWQWLSAVRALFCIFGWFLTAYHPSESATGDELRGMLQVVADKNATAGLARAERGNKRSEDGEKGDAINGSNNNNSNNMVVGGT